MPDIEFPIATEQEARQSLSSIRLEFSNITVSTERRSALIAVRSAIYKKHPNLMRGARKSS